MGEDWGLPGKGQDNWRVWNPKRKNVFRWCLDAVLLKVCILTDSNVSLFYFIFLFLVLFLL